MNRTQKRHFVAFVLCLLFSSLLAPAAAQATSDYDGVIETVNGVHLSRDGSTQGSPMCTSVDITSSWANILTSSSSWTSRTQIIAGATQSTTLAAWATTLDNGVGWSVVQQHFNSAASPNDGSPIGDAVYVVFTPSASAQVNFSSSPIYYGAQKQAYLTNADSGYVYSVRIQFDDLGSPGGSDQCTPVISMALRESIATNWFRENLSVATTSTEGAGGYILRPLFVNAPINYPSGYEGELAPALPVIDYVGTGDSYSSGQGSHHPYMSGTETETNECRRSPVAYPKLLDTDGSVNFNLTRFVACGGATTSAITTDGFNGEDAQMDAITSGTDLVTMTITGNDVPFSALGEACAMPSPEHDCTLEGDAYLEAVGNIDSQVKPHLEDMLETVDDKLTSVGSDARVLVIGYPQLLNANYQTNSECWGWLSGGEHEAIRSFTALLNSAIKTKVDAKGGQFQFVSATESSSPFIGHEICRFSTDEESNYFNGVVIGENWNDTFHPNALGQQAYAQLIKSHLALHPLS